MMLETLIIKVVMGCCAAGCLYLTFLGSLNHGHRYEAESEKKYREIVASLSQAR